MAAPKPLPSGSSRSHGGPEAETMIGPFKRLESIGKGSFAMVYRGVHMKKRSLVAIKSVDLNKLNKKLKDNLLSEIKILRSMHHPHIVALIDCQESSIHMHIVMEFCELGDLSTFIKKRHSLADHPTTADMIRKYPNPAVGGLNEVVVRHFLKQIASALGFLRSKNYVHRDLKPQNLLLNPSPLFYAKFKPEAMPLMIDENSLIPAAGLQSLPMLKVADFGFARVLPQTSLAETLCGSPLYMAPEILRYEKYDAKADLWSVGTVLHEMMVSKPPFRANNHVDLLRKIEKQDDYIPFQNGIVVSRDMKSLIRGLLKKQPTERMGYESFFDNIVVREDIPGVVGNDRPSEPQPEVVAVEKTSRKQSGDIGESSRTEPRPKVERATYSQSPKERPSFGTTPPSRPISRPTIGGQPSGTPPKSSFAARRYSNAPANEAEPVPTSQRERRPTITSHATAPTRPGSAQERNLVSAAVAMDRRNSRNSPSPSSSMLREHFDRERNPQREDRVIREARERAAQDVAFEKEYVLVEKRNVEVNAFADELAASPQLRVGSRDHPSSPQQGTMVRRATTQVTNNAGSNPSRAIQIAPGRQRPDQIHQRKSSYERRYGPSPISATSAISRALTMANFRLFGTGPSPPGKGASPPKGYGAFPTYPTAQQSLLVLGDGLRGANSKDEDTRTLMQVEELAHCSDVVYGFADVKYKQLLPATPSSEGLGIGQAGLVGEETAADDDMTIEAIITVSEEALVLYVKALSLLAKSVDIAGSWWGHKNRSQTYPDGGRPNSPNRAAITDRMNQIVQWVRNRFNECCEKSEFASRKLVEAQKRLPADHPGHPNNHPSASTSTNSFGTSAENIYLSTGVTAEKLIYDRAVEMSRSAAVNELVGQDYMGCELSYVTAIRMLNAILEKDEDPPTRQIGNKDSRADDEAVNGLEAEDRQSVLKLVEGTRGRLKALRKKIEEQKSVKRQSLSGAPTGHGRSPSGTPHNANTPPR